MTLATHTHANPRAFVEGVAGRVAGELLTIAEGLRGEVMQLVFARLEWPLNTTATAQGEGRMYLIVDDSDNLYTTDNLQAYLETHAAKGNDPNDLRLYECKEVTFTATAIPARLEVKFGSTATRKPVAKPRAEKADAKPVEVADILAAIGKGAKVGEIAKSTGGDPRVISRQLAKLRDDGQLRVEGEKRATTYYLREPGNGAQA